MLLGDLRERRHAEDASGVDEDVGRADFANDDLKQWGVIQCGGQGGTCPCLAPFYDPPNQVNYGSGSCSTSNSNTPLSVAPAQAS